MANENHFVGFSRLHSGGARRHVERWYIFEFIELNDDDIRGVSYTCSTAENEAKTKPNLNEIKRHLIRERYLADKFIKCFHSSSMSVAPIRECEHSHMA